MLGNIFKRNKKHSIYAFADGVPVALKNVKDDVFASHTLGKGMAIKPYGNTLYAPCDGKTDNVSDTLHALTMSTDFGAEILLHIGIDTVNLRGKFFTAHVKNGQKVNRGDKLITFEREKIEYEGYDSTICMAICNSDDYNVNEVASFSEKVTKDDVLIILE